jgi:hypothetical protein
VQLTWFATSLNSTAAIGKPPPVAVRSPAIRTYTSGLYRVPPRTGLFETFLATLNGGDYYSPSVGQDVSAGVGTCLANHCDWRIPTVAELQTIVELSASGCGSGSPCIDPAFGPTQAAFYWSSSSFGAAGLSAWWVYFPNGIAGLQPKMVPLNIYARAVRGGR